MRNPVISDTTRHALVTDALRAATDAEIRAALMGADIMALRVALYQLTGDPDIGAIRADDTERGGDRILPPSINDLKDRALIIERAFELLISYRDGAAAPPQIHPAQLQPLMELMFARDFPEADMDYWWFEFAAKDHKPAGKWFEPIDQEKATAFPVLVIGSGMSGLGASIALKAAGIPFTIIEKNAGVGGTWHENIYPGSRVDVASRAYSYTFEADYTWKHYFATREELQNYFDYVASKYGILENIRFRAEVTAATWNEDRQVWEVTVASDNGVEVMEARAVLSAVGLFNRPMVADIAGLSTFKGITMHTAQWDPSVELRGRRIAVIGTGSSGVQITSSLAAVAGHLTVFQRAGTWVSDVPNHRTPVPEAEQWMLDNFPYYLNWARLTEVNAVGDTRLDYLKIDRQWNDPDTVSKLNLQVREGLMRYLEAKIGDRPDLIAKCVPKYPPMSKRLPKDNGWFDALRQDNVELVVEGIECVTPTGVLTSDGVHHELDILVVATGFHANDYLWPMQITGRDGITLEKAWDKDGARAYLGMTIPGFPNLFCFYGPNTNGPTGGPFPWGEMQARYVAEAIRYLIEHGLGSMEVKKEVFEEFNDRLDGALANMIWMDPRQTSYNRNEFGRVATNGAFKTIDYWQWTIAPNVDEYIWR